jgi:hypothetical protein
MNKRIKAKWVKALRSGKYKKGVGQLAKVITVPIKGDEWYETEVVGEKFCCLGVLCDLYDKEKKQERSWDIYRGSLPLEVQQWAGLDSDDPKVDFDIERFNKQNPDKTIISEDVRLSTLNDTVCVVRKKGFGMIADVIEKQL